MAGKVAFYKIDSQPPLIQLIITFLVVVTFGTLIFYLFIFAGSIIFRLSPGDMLLLPVNATAKNVFILRYVQVSQQLSLFLIPSIVLVMMIRKEGESFLGIEKSPELLNIFLAISFAFLIIPVNSYTGILNSRLTLPGWLSGIEDWMQMKEENASRLTELLSTSPNLATVAINIIILAVIPAFSEEFLFRGVVQQLFCRLLKSAVAGIGLTAILFSTIHFQFFGFIPRLILGLSYGYLFYWSRNLWIPVIAHFVNNIIPVIITWYSGLDGIKRISQDSGHYDQKVPYIYIMLCGMIIFFFRYECRRKESKKEKGIS